MKQYGVRLPKDQDELIELCRQQDWNVSKTANGHWRLVNKQGKVAIASGTPSDTNAVLDLRARLKRFGLKPGKLSRIKPTLTEPKLVVDRSAVVEEKSVSIHSTPLAAVVAVGKKERKATPGVRGGRLRNAIVEVLREHDRPEGWDAPTITGWVNEKMHTQLTGHTVGQSVIYYTNNGNIFTRVGHAHYRLTSMITTQPTAAAPIAEEDDEKVLIEFLVGLDKVANIIKRHIELQKALAGVLQKLGTNK